MDKIITTILSTIIFSILLFSYIIPLYHIFALEEFQTANIQVEPIVIQQVSNLEGSSFEIIQDAGENKIAAGENSGDGDVEQSRNSEIPLKEPQQIVTSAGTDRSSLAPNPNRDSDSDSPPKKIRSLSIQTVSSSELRLKWRADQEPDFSHYNIYSSSKSSFRVSPGATPPTGQSTSNSYLDSGLSPSTTYYYKVAVVDKAGNIGELSSTKRGKTQNAIFSTEENYPKELTDSSASNSYGTQEFTTSETTTATTTTRDLTPPAQVTGLIATTQSSIQINLDWNSNSESDFNHYNIFRSTSSGFIVNPRAPTYTSTSSSFSDTGLSPSTKYYYKVAAVDDSGNVGPMSSEKSATTTSGSSGPPPSDTTPPAQVTGLTATAQSSTQINLDWSSNTESDFNHYNIYRGTSANFAVTLGATQPLSTPSSSSFSNTGLSPSTTYYYKVAAVDDTGNISPLSSEKSSTTLTSSDTTPPAQVAGLIASAQSSSQINLGWNQNSESDLDHYNVYRGLSANFPVTLGVTQPSGTSKANSYSSTGLTPSTTYYYKVAAVDNAGNFGPLSSERSATTLSGSSSPRDSVPPSQVTGLTASAQSSTQINLDWNSNTESDFNHYNIYRSTSNGFGVNPRGTPPTATSTDSSFSNNGLSPSSKYYYRVAAVDNAGNVGRLSSQVSATTSSGSSGPPPDTTPPAQVTGLTASAQSSTQINLGWNSNTESDFNHYNIYRGTSSGFGVNLGVTQPSGTSNANSYSSTGLSPSTTYYYKIAAVDNAGNIGALSSERSATTLAPPDTTPPAQVVGLTASAQSSTQINLDWDSNTESDLDHYNVYRGTSANFAVTLGVTQPLSTPTSSSFSNTGLSPSTTYYYKVAAVDNAGNIGVLSSEQSESTLAPPDTTPPAQVAGLTATAQSSTQINLDWSSNTESDFNHYNVYRGTSANFAVTLGTTGPLSTPTSSSFSNTGLNPSTTYYYKVAAVDDAGNIGTLSSEDSATTLASADTSPPAQVSGLTATAQSSTQINLAWNSNGESDLNHYNIYRGTSANFAVTLGVTQPLSTPTSSSFSNTGLSPSTTYYYKVAAVDNAGNIGVLSSEQSESTLAPPDTSPPAQVSGLTATAQSSTQINLAWNSNGESDLNHYNIYRGTSANFAVTLGVTQPLGTSGTNSYSSTGLSPSTTYYYKVAAVDNAGNIGALSSERSAATLAPPDTSPPAQVSGLTATAQSSTQINLAWTSNGESDLNHYNIYRGTSANFAVNLGTTVPISTPTSSSFSNTGLSPSTTYYYKVAAVDNAGNIGALSSERSAATLAPPDTSPPAQVSGLTATAQSSTQINLAWTSNGESDLNHYNIYRGTSANFAVTLGVTQPLGTSGTNSYSSTGLSPSTTYYYKVAAVDNTGNIGTLSSERSATTTSGSTGQAKAGIYVPLFTYPTDSSWTAVVNAKNAHPTVPFLVTINPSSGVGGSQDGNFVTGINKLKNAGIKVIGYVYTSYGGRSFSAVNSEIDKYKSWYNVDGVFFDEMTNALGSEQYYSTATAYAKSIGMTITVGNPGTDTRPSYIGTVDTMMTYESKGLPSDSQLKGSNNWHLNYDKNNFSIIPYGVPSLDPAYVSNAAQYVGWIYITNDDLPNPWNSIPSYFDSLIRAVE